MLTRSQVILSPVGHPVDVSIPAVKIAMDLFGVTDHKACLLRVLKVWQAIEGKRRESAD